MEVGLAEVKEPEQQLFDCCICSQCTSSTNERLIGLVTLLQPSSGRSYIQLIALKSVYWCTFCYVLLITSKI